MAGSYSHCVDDQGRFQGVKLLDDLGDAYEALEEMYGMIWWLADQVRDLDPFGPNTAKIVEEARQEYKDGIEISPGYADGQ